MRLLLRVERGRLRVVSLRRELQHAPSPYRTCGSPIPLALGIPHASPLRPLPVFILALRTCRLLVGMWSEQLIPDPSSPFWVRHARLILTLTAGLALLIGSLV